MADLRDHSQPCEHGNSAWIPGTLLLGKFGRSDLWQCSEMGCPGGRAVTDDELVRMAAEAQQANPALAAVWADIFAAAIGDIPSTVTSADWFNRDDNI